MVGDDELEAYNAMYEGIEEDFLGALDESLDARGPLNAELLEERLLLFEVGHFDTRRIDRVPSTQACWPSPGRLTRPS